MRKAIRFILITIIFLTFPVVAAAVVGLDQNVITVSSESGVGMAGQTIVIEDVGGNKIAEGTTNEDGQVRICLSEDDEKQDEDGIPCIFLDSGNYVIISGAEAVKVTLAGDGTVATISAVTPQKQTVRFYAAAAVAGAFSDDLEESVDSSTAQAVADGFSAQSDADSSAIGGSVTLGTEYYYSDNSNNFIDFSFSYLDGFEMDGDLNATITGPGGIGTVNSSGDQEISAIIAEILHYWAITEQLFLGAGIGVGRFEFDDSSTLTSSLNGVPFLTVVGGDDTTDTAAIISVGGKFYFTDHFFALLNGFVTLNDVGFNDETLWVGRAGIGFRF